MSSIGLSGDSRLGCLSFDTLEYEGAKENEGTEKYIPNPDNPVSKALRGKLFDSGFAVLRHASMMKIL